MNSLAKKAKQLFVDSLRIHVRGGKGGHGLPQYGGIGGKGGDVYIKGSTKIHSLKTLQRMTQEKLQAGDGMSSRRTRLLGESGRDLIIKVPLGITVEDSQRQFIGDINHPTDKVIVAMGGRGGDKFNDNQGFAGQARTIRLDLKMISDAVFVGFPNAGKSSLLRAVSRAEPKVANYPFTTLRPSIGTITYPDFRQIQMADLPGLVEGAHKNLGLGHEFLKHTIRSRLLVFVIDINNVDLGPNYAKRTPLQTMCILNKEIELYDDTILNKPAILVMSKMDSTIYSQDMYLRFKDEFASLRENPENSTLVEPNLLPTRLIKFSRILPLSSVSRFNIDKFKTVAREVIDEDAEARRAEEFSTYKELQPLENNRISQ